MMPPRLLADVGGTFARFALQAPGRGAKCFRILRTADYPGIEAAVADYLSAQAGPRPRVAAIAVAAPVTGTRVKLTNAAWTIAPRRMQAALKLDRVHLINDFEALAWALGGLGAAGRVKIGGGQPARGQVRAVFGPGTGLGVAGFLPEAAGGPAAIATEGGHATLAAGNAREASVIAVLRERFGHVSAERLLSGPGLANIYEAIAALEGRALHDRPYPGDIARRATAGGDPAAREAVRMFSALLGQFGGDVALMLGARGGVYVAGGVVGRLGRAFDRRAFRARFEAKGRYKSWLGRVPTYLITHERAAMIGLARFLDRA